MGWRFRVAPMPQLYSSNTASLWTMRTKTGTLLHRTVWGMRQQHIDTARVLVRDGGADPDGLDGDGLPPSHRAASRGWKEMVEALLELGADATLQAGESGDTLLHVAVRSQSVELVGAVLRGWW